MTLPLHLDIRTASMLYILIDIAANSLTTENETISKLEAEGKLSDISAEELQELKVSLETLLSASKQLKLDIGEIVSTFDDKTIPFSPSIPTTGIFKQG